jgi:hypothetical protein
LLWVGIAAGVLVAALIVVWIVGWSLPAEHEVMRTLRLGQQPTTLWNTITDFEQMPSWNPNVRKVERLPDRDGCEVWRETYRNNDQLILKTTEAARPRQLRREIADDALPFRGSWEMVIYPATGGCRLSVIERGEIPSPFTRVMFRLFHDPARNVDEDLQALAADFAEPLRIEQRRK